MPEHEHKYAKLNDEAVFCRGCGDIKRQPEAACALPHYQPMWIYYPPTYPTITPWTPTPWWGTTTQIGSGSYTFTNGEASS